MQDEGCIPFARHRAHGGASMATAWCDSTTLGKHETSLHGLRFITKALNDFSSKPEILSQAWTRLSMRSSHCCKPTDGHTSCAQEKPSISASA